MADNKQIIKEADYYLNNDVTIEQASKDLGISKRTLQIHMKKLESIEPDKYKLVTDKKLNNEKQGKIKGGTLGKRVASWTEEDALKIANKMIEDDLTYREAGKRFGIPPSTIHSMISQINKEPQTDSLLYSLALAHQRGMTIEEFIKVYNSEHAELSKLANDIKMEDIVTRHKK